MDTLTPRQQQILDFLQRYQVAHGLPPTILEIAAAFGLASPNGVAQHLKALARKGVLELKPQQARGIRLRVAPAEAADAEDTVALLALPVLGRVAAGAPIGPGLAAETLLRLDPALFSPRPDYLLIVQGDSMQDDGILDGDLVAVQQCAEARHRQIVVARIDGEVTIKRLDLGPTGLRLLPRNPAYAPIVVPPEADFAIEGLYCGLIRRGVSP
jgi:repressor LexA